MISSMSTIDSKKRGIKYNPDLVLWFINRHQFFIMPEAYAPKEIEIESQFSNDEEKKNI